MASNIESGISRAKPPGIPIDQIIIRSTFVAQNGRPLLELNADSDIINMQKRNGVIFAMRRNTQRDVRKEFRDKKMNVPAMQEIRKNMQTLLDDCAWINTQYLGEELPSEVTAKEVDTMALVATWLPSYLVFRAREPLVQDNLPNNVAGVSKASDGIRAVTGSMLRQELGDSVVTAESIYEYANTSHFGLLPTLVSEDVCPASEYEIVKTADALVTRKGGDAIQSSFGQFFTHGEFKTLLDFSVIAGAVEDLFDTSVSTAQERNAEIQQYLAFGIDPNSSLVRAARASLNTLVTNLNTTSLASEKVCNRLLGRDASRVVRLE